MYKRPISPHLQIYNIFSKEMTSGPSFLNRVTRTILAVGSIYICAWLVCLSLGEVAYNYFLLFINSWFGVLSLLGLSAAFYYYLINGIRFLMFDLGYFLNKKNMFISGIIMIITTVSIYLITWMYIFINYYMGV